MKLKNCFRSGLFTGKKGITDTLLFAIRMFVILPILFFLNMYANSFVVTNVNTSSIESELFLERFLYSSGGFLYHDLEINRNYPGVIDISRFNENITSQVLMLDDFFTSIKFDLIFEDGTINTTYYNKKHFLMYSQLSGIGDSITKQQRKYFVNVKYGDDFKNAILLVNMVFVDG